MKTATIGAGHIGLVSGIWASFSSIKNDVSLFPGKQRHNLMLLSPVSYLRKVDQMIDLRIPLAKSEVLSKTSVFLIARLLAGKLAESAKKNALKSMDWRLRNSDSPMETRHFLMLERVAPLHSERP